jgi:tetraprenyl-beta-curcumene synthase
LLDARRELAPARRPSGRAATFLRVGAEARPLAGAWAALLVANVRYWRTVAPLADARIEHWRARAREIADAPTRSLALAKLDGERFNAEAGAMLATFAPASQRADVVEAIVALQLLFDLLDGLSERPTAQPIADGERLFAVFTSALRAEPPAPPAPAAPPTPAESTPAEPPTPEPPIPAADYMTELAGAARRAFSGLPATDAVLETAHAAATRAAAAQIHMHAAPQLGVAQLRHWAETLTAESSLPWRELAAGAASSVLCVHALIAAAADPRTTSAQAAEIDRAYLSICVLLTLLDSLTDREQDVRDRRFGYVDLYDDDERLAAALDSSLARADARARRLPQPARKLMMLAAVVAYYASAPGARGVGAAEPGARGGNAAEHGARRVDAVEHVARGVGGAEHVARGVDAAEHVARLKRGLQPLIAPTLLVLRLWRARRQRQGRG